MLIKKIMVLGLAWIACAGVAVAASLPGLVGGSCEQVGTYKGPDGEYQGVALYQCSALNVSFDFTKTQGVSAIYMTGGYANPAIVIQKGSHQYIAQCMTMPTESPDSSVTPFMCDESNGQLTVCTCQQQQNGPNSPACKGFIRPSYCND